MPRIRTIKPEFFKHGGLFDAEKKMGLPLRLAFAGLWTCCDREGRFKWRPRELKTDVLPYDDCDFSQVLDALAAHGFVVKYRSGSDFFGHIPTWEKHQVINNRETESKLPNPLYAQRLDACLTRDARVEDTCLTPQEGKGREREGKGREGEKQTHHPPARPASPVSPAPIPIKQTAPAKPKLSDPGADTEVDIPNGITYSQGARYVLNAAGITVDTWSMTRTVDELRQMAIWEHCDEAEATRRMLSRMFAGMARGEKVDEAWIKDRNWKKSKFRIA